MNQVTPQKRSQARKTTLTDFLRQRTAFIVDPVVEALARRRLGPDALTVAGMAAHLLVGWFIATGQMRAAAVTILLTAPLDALDGALARKLGRKRDGFGAFLDSTLDRVAEIFLFGGFIFYYVAQANPVMLGVTYAAITGSLMVSYARARAEAMGLECKVGLFSRVERYTVIIFFLFFNLPAYALIILSVLTYITLAQRMLHVWRQTREG